MNQPWRHIEGFLAPDGCEDLRRLLDTRSDRIYASKAPLRLGPNYRTMRGEDIQRYLPELVEFGETRIRPLAEEFAGRRLRIPHAGRAVRIQIFDDPGHHFPWHYDRSAVDCLLTLRNDNSTETQFISPGLSRAVRPLYKLLFGGSSMFSILPHRSVRPAPGDLLLLAGRGVLHRGIPTAPTGERFLLVFAYEDVDQRPQPWRDRIIRYKNTGSLR